MVYISWPRSCTAQQLGLPFYAHMHDLWLENTQRGTAQARLAALWEPRICATLRGYYV